MGRPRAEQPAAPTGPPDLLNILASQPRMPGALCRNPDLWPLFDASATDIEAQRDAGMVCAMCVHQPICAAWYLSLPVNERPSGVVGGLMPPLKPRWQPKPSVVPESPQNARGRTKPPTGVQSPAAQRRAQRLEVEARRSARRAAKTARATAAC